MTYNTSQDIHSTIKYMPEFGTCLLSVSYNDNTDCNKCKQLTITIPLSQLEKTLRAIGKGTFQRLVEKQCQPCIQRLSPEHIQNLVNIWLEDGGEIIHIKAGAEPLKEAPATLSLDDLKIGGLNVPL